MNEKEHRIGKILLVLCIAYYYIFPLFPLYIFPLIELLISGKSTIFSESTVLAECLFLIPYLALLIITSVYFYKNNLFKEHIVLNIFTLIFANGYTLSLMSIIPYWITEGTAAEDIVSKILYIFAYPLDVLYTDAAMIIFIISPLIPLVSLIVSFWKKDTNSKSSDDISS